MTSKLLFGPLVLIIATSLDPTTWAGPPDRMPPIHPPEWYERHILAIDEDGNGLRPNVIASNRSDPRYKAHYSKLEGEDTRKAVVDSAQLSGATLSTNKPKRPYSDGMQAALDGRTTLTTYIGDIFKEIDQKHPEELVIYIHGGLNNIDGAIAKSALLADVLDAEHKYFIGICWNSNLMPTYDAHLLAVREGLHQKEKAIVTAPAMLLADVGGAAARFPLNLIDFLYQDAYTTDPTAFTRTKLARARYNQIKNAYYDNPSNAVNRMVVFQARDERSKFDKWFIDFGRWALTYPVKAGSTIALDWLGIQPWKNMLRRTRTMFERESEFIPDLTYDQATKLEHFLGKTTPVPTFIDQLNYSGRKGAMWHFGDQAQRNLVVRDGVTQPTVTIIGHSMGAIVAADLLHRFHRLPVDNLILMAAACSINDFKNKIVPYLEEQDFRERIVARAPTTSAMCGPIVKTHVFNLCLNDEAEHIEPNPGQLDLSQRGSQLTWIDTLYQTPESENDRTFGRWINAVLATDDLPKDVIPRITIKGFGLDRQRRENSPVYTAAPGSAKEIDEPTKHGEFSRYDQGRSKLKSNFRFWDRQYREAERDTSTHRRRAATLRNKNDVTSIRASEKLSQN